MSGLLAGQQQARILAESSYITLFERWYEINMQSMVPVETKFCFMARHFHFCLVCPLKTCDAFMCRLQQQQSFVLSFLKCMVINF